MADLNLNLNLNLWVHQVEGKMENKDKEMNIHDMHAFTHTKAMITDARRGRRIRIFIRLLRSQ
jgi:hypothetical protein